MTTRLLISCLLLTCGLRAQQISGVYKINDLLSRIDQKDTAYVVNFWATWCKPCVEELPAFDSLTVSKSGLPVKVLLVSLDFKEDIDKKVKPFLSKRQVKSQVILLDETNGNEFVDKISPEWSGAIPATLFKKGSKRVLVERKQKLKQLEEHLQSVQ
jgi:thiol-disulfide isomerase/thioredoxin